MAEPEKVVEKVVEKNPAPSDADMNDAINKVVDDAKKVVDPEKVVDDPEKVVEPDKNKKVDKTSAFSELNPADKKPDVDPDKKEPEEIKLPEGTPEKVSNSFAQQRVQHREAIQSLTAERDDLKKKVAEGGGDGEAMKKLTEENTNLTKRLGQLDVKQTPEYKETILDPREKIKAALEKIWKENELEGSVEGLLAKSGRSLSVAVDEISEKLTTAMDRNKLARHVEAFEVLGEMEASIIDNADVASDAIYQNNAKRMEDVFEGRYTQITSGKGMLMEKLEPNEKASDTEKASVANYNESIDRVHARAHKMATGIISESDMADICIKAAGFDHLTDSGVPRLNVEYMAMRRALGETLAKLQELEGGGPTPNGGDDGDPITPAKTDGKYSDKEWQSTLDKVVADMVKKK